MIRASEGHPAEENLWSGSQPRHTTGVSSSCSLSAIGLPYGDFVSHPFCFYCLMCLVAVETIGEIIESMVCSHQMIVPDLK